MHVPYEIKLNQPADFKVSYRFYTKQEGGKDFLPFQGYRSDFWYEDTEHSTSQVFMIWPEFEDDNGNIIMDTNQPIKSQGIAKMWILMPPMRSYHKQKIKVGLKGYFMEGSRRVAECTIIQLIGLLHNPTEPIEIKGKVYR